MREAGYLTTFNGSAVAEGAVTVIGTGDTPLPLVRAQSPRDIFFDADLTDLSDVSGNVSLTANTAFSEVFGEVRGLSFNSSQAETLQRQVSAAHEKGLMVRYWDTPGWPVGTRNAVWRILWEEGVDLVNVDDLEAGAGFWEGRG